MEDYHVSCLFARFPVRYLFLKKKKIASFFPYDLDIFALFLKANWLIHFKGATLT